MKHRRRKNLLDRKASCMHGPGTFITLRLHDERQRLRMTIIQQSRLEKLSSEWAFLFWKQYTHSMKQAFIHLQLITTGHLLRFTYGTTFCFGLACRCQHVHTCTQRNVSSNQMPKLQSIRPLSTYNYSCPILERATMSFVYKQTNAEVKVSHAI